MTMFKLFFVPSPNLRRFSRPTTKNELGKKTMNWEEEFDTELTSRV